MSTSRMNVFRRVIAIAALLWAPSAFAHNGEDHSGKTKSFKGTVETVQADKLMMKATDGKSVVVHLDDKTTYERGTTAAAATDVKPGARVVVHGHPMKDGGVHATKVRLGRAPGKPVKDETAAHGQHQHQPGK
jgi:predicted transcriptional regulator